MTCAHNVYNNDAGEEYKLKDFSVSVNDGKSNENYDSEILNSYIPEDYRNNTNSIEDYAILVLNKKLGETFGYMGIAFDYDLEKDREYNLYGYPE